MYLDFTCSYTQTLNITEIDSFTCRGVENGSLVITNNVITKLGGRFDNLWPACTRDLMPPSRQILGGCPRGIVESVTSRTEKYVWNAGSDGVRSYNNY